MGMITLSFRTRTENTIKGAKEKRSFQTLFRGVKEGRSPSYHIFPFPTGEGDKGDGASTTELE
jgi:hypothetical protein